MKRAAFYSLAVLLTLLLCPALSWGGAAVTFHDFRPGTFLPNDPLPHLDNKAMVAQFLDPGNAGLGQGIGYFLWREILTAISDQARAGVIIGRNEGGRPIVDMLRKEYHEAATQAARGLKSWIALWGVVEASGDEVFLKVYISILPDVKKAAPMLQLLSMEGSGKNKPIPNIALEMPRTLFSFSLQGFDRKKLFRRAIIARQQVLVREKPDRDAPIVARIKKDEALHMTDVEGVWLKVSTDNGKTGFVKMEDNSPVDIPGLTVTANVPGKIKVYQSPDKRSRLIAEKALQGEYAILNRRYIDRRGLWYCLDVDGVQGWVEGFTMTEKYSSPVVDFVAGMLRYGALNYKGAKSHFQRFVSLGEQYEKNVNLAFAYQMMGACQLKMGDQNPTAFEKAVVLTPYDPNAYALNGFAQIVLSGSLRKGLPSLEKALDLDDSNPQAQFLLTLAEQIVSHRVDERVRVAIRSDVDPAVIKGLRDKHPGLAQ